MRTIARVAAGLLSKEHSVATGLLIALTAWTLTRLVDGVTGSNTLEYDARYEPYLLASGEVVSRVQVKLSNLSADAVLKDLTVTVRDPEQKARFIKPADCRYAPPSWAGNGHCDVFTQEGLLFTAPALVSGSYVWFAVLYRGSIEEKTRPVIRIKPGDAGELRIMRPGVATFIARNESTILLALLGLTLGLLVLSVSAGIRREREGNAS